MRSPAARRHDETFPVIGSLDDFDAQAWNLGEGVCNLASIVTGIGPHEFEPWKALADLVQHHARAITVLQARGMDDDP